LGHEQKGKEMIQLSDLLSEIVQRDKDLVIELLKREVERLRSVISDLEKKPFPPVPRQGASAQIDINLDKISPENRPHVQNYIHSSNSSFQKVFGVGEFEK